MIELKEKSSPLFIIAAVAMTIITIMGVWWLFLLLELSKRLTAFEGDTGGVNISRLIIWEGTFFIVLLIFVSTFFIVLFTKDIKKNKSIHAFFAGLTHELKTPLASIRLQSEVLQDEVSKISNSKIEKLTSRLIDDSKRLESQMDKMLQLSRIERGGNLNSAPLNIQNLITNVFNNLDAELTLELNTKDSQYEIIGDEFALEVIFRNLFENTKNHTNSKKIIINILENTENKTITLKYYDEGNFKGNIKKLGNLFYKFESSKGSGIGLYLTSKLIKKMNGSFKIEKDVGLVFIISLPMFEGEKIDV